MSEFNVVVVKIEKISKHPNADSLSITHVLGNYPVVFKTGEFKEGDKAVYIPIDSVIPHDEPGFEFLGEHRRIKARRLRGIFSMGLLVPIKNKSWEIGRNVQDEYRITKYEPDLPLSMGGEQERDPGFIPVYTDIEGLRKWPEAIREGEKVVITEKIHGTSSRYIYKEGRLWVGSHKTIKKENKDNLYWKIAYQYNFPKILKHYEDYVFYGEIYGSKIQDLAYGCKLNEHKLIIFDIFNINNGNYLDWEEFIKICNEVNLPIPPLLYIGKWNKDLIKYGEGISMMQGANHIKEGFVVKPVKERWDDRLGRVILKYIGESFYLRKEK